MNEIIFIPESDVISEVRVKPRLTDYQKAARLEYKFFQRMCRKKSKPKHSQQQLIALGQQQAAAIGSGVYVSYGSNIYNQMGYTNAHQSLLESVFGPYAR